MALFGAPVEYALHAVVCLAGCSTPVSAHDAAAYLSLPEAYLAKLFTQLEKAGVLRSAAGIDGGFTLARPARRISVADVIAALSGQKKFFVCSEVRRRCVLFDGDPPAWSIRGRCQIDAFMHEAQAHLQEFFATKSIADIAGEVAQKAPAKFLADTTKWFDGRQAGRRKKE